MVFVNSLQTRKNFAAQISAWCVVALFLFSFSQIAFGEQEPIYPDTFSKIAKKCLPSVVSITGTITMKVSDHERIPDGFDRFFRDFFGHEDSFGRRRSPEFQPRMPQERPVAGSGVIIRSDGYILTNAHVVSEIKPEKIEVVTFDKMKFTGVDIEQVWVDVFMDLAVIKVNARDLPAMEWGDSDELEIGDWVLALGSPLRFDNSVTQGIVSSKHREIGKSASEDLIQTTAAINPGNSGGPLVNIKGQLVGINMAIITTSGLWQGIGFSIPSNDVRHVADSLIEHGKVRRGFLGVDPEPLTPELAKSLGYDRDYGVFIREVTKNTPAEGAGIRVYDIINEIDGKKIEDLNDIFTVVAGIDPGSTVDVRIFREEIGEKVLKVTLAERDEKQLVSSLAKRSESKPVSHDVLGLELRVQRLEHGQADEVIVTGVRSSSPALRAGIRRGDKIVEVNKFDIHSIEDVAMALKKQKQGRDHLFLIGRSGSMMFVLVPRN